MEIAWKSFIEERKLILHRRYLTYELLSNFPYRIYIPVYKPYFQSSLPLIRVDISKSPPFDPSSLHPSIPIRPPSLFHHLRWKERRKTGGSGRAIRNGGSRNARGRGDGWYAKSRDSGAGRGRGRGGEEFTRGAQLDAFVLSEAEDITRKRARGRG